VNAECDFTARNLATHKWAIAAWNQTYRHGQQRVELQGDVRRADLAQIQRCRDERLVVLDKVTVCLVGGIAPDTAFPILSTELGGIRSSARLPGPAKAKGGSLEVGWDLPARHLLLTWPIPDFAHQDYAALMAASQWLTMRLSQDPALKASTGMAFAGTDLITAEGAHFYVSASLKPEATFDGVREQLNAHLRALRTDSKALAEVPMLAQQLAWSLSTVPSPAVFQGQAPPNVSLAMLEANIGLQYGMNEYRYGPRRVALASQLAAVTAAKVQTAAQHHLGDEKLTLCAIRPQ
jgi:predicted Zn-dependent peptidase